jgi:hypothetical protein
MALRCLIVDDNAGFGDEVRALLEPQGISVGGGAEVISQSVTAFVPPTVRSARRFSESSVRGARDRNWRVAVSLAHAQSKREARFTAPMRWR